MDSFGSQVMKVIDDWNPCRWNSQLENCLWLPRMLDKGRRYLESQQHQIGKDHLNGFLFGDLDFSDWRLLRFLRTNQDRVCELLTEFDSDQKVASQLLKESGKTSDEVHRWNRKFYLINCIFIPLWDADEGYRKPGVTTEIIKIFYKFLIMPPIYLAYRISSFLSKRK